MKILFLDNSENIVEKEEFVFVFKKTSAEHCCEQYLLFLQCFQMASDAEALTVNPHQCLMVLINRSISSGKKRSCYISCLHQITIVAFYSGEFKLRLKKQPVAWKSLFCGILRQPGNT